MPVTVVLSRAEAALVAENPGGGVLNGVKFTYDPTATAAILAGLSKTDASYVAFAGRMGEIATRLGLPNALFKTASAAESAPAPTVAAAPAEAPSPSTPVTATAEPVSAAEPVASTGPKPADASAAEVEAPST